MEESNRKVSESQKAAQKKYDKKTKMVSVKYTPSDMEDYERLKEYLSKTGQHTNKFIKSLINDFFNSGKGKVYDDDLDRKLHDIQEYWIYTHIEKKDMQPIVDRLGFPTARRILSMYADMLKKSTIKNREVQANIFLDWLEGIKMQMELGEYDNLSDIRKYCKIKDDFNKYIDEKI